MSTIKTSRAANAPTRLRMIRLEQRFMFDGAAVATADQVAAPDPLKIAPDSAAAVAPAPNAANTDATAASDAPNTPATTPGDAPTTGAAVDTVQDPAGAAETGATEASAPEAAQQAPIHLLELAQAQAVAPAIRATLQTAQAQAERAVQGFLAQPNAQQQMFALFNGGQTAPSEQWQAAYEQLHTALQDPSGESNLALRLELRSTAELQGSKGAFAAEGSTGAATIYLNRDWLDQGAGVNEIASVLAEEIGHSFDAKLNGAIDTAGDEGEAFAAAVSGSLTTDSVILAQVDDDHSLLSIDGQSVAVEMALPGDNGWLSLVRKTDPNGGSNGIDGSWTANAPDLVGTAEVPYLQYMFTGSNSSVFNLKLRVEPRATDPVGIPDAHFLFDMNKDGIPDFTILLQVTKNNITPSVDSTTGLNGTDAFTYKLWLLPLVKGTSAEANVTPNTTTIDFSSSTSFLIYDSASNLHSEGTGSGTSASISRTTGNTYTSYRHKLAFLECLKVQRE